MIDQVLFSENELKQLSDRTLYFIYKGYYDQAFVDYINGNDEAYIKHRDIANRIKKINKKNKEWYVC